MAWSTTAPPAGTATKRVLVLATIGLTIAVAVTSYLAFTNHQTGQRWLERARLAEADVEQLDQANSQLETDLADVRGALKKSERDVGRLERRVSKVADEKARAEDDRELATAYLERTAEIAVAYDEVATQFQICRSETSGFTGMLADADYYYDTGQWYLVSQQAASADAACGAAEQLLSELRSYVDALT